MSQTTAKHQFSEDVPKSSNGMPYITSDDSGTIFISFRFCGRWWQMRCPKASLAWYFREESGALWKPVKSGEKHVSGITAFNAQELLKFQILRAVRYGMPTSSHINE